jgi:hypothetical protein
VSEDFEELDEGEQRALARTNLPGNLLIATGALNLLAGLLLLNVGVQHLRMPTEVFEKNVPSNQLDALQRQGWTTLQTKQLFATILLIWAGVAIASSIVIFYGGVNMRSLNSYAFALVGSVLAAAPILSPLGCFGIGQVVGIWALVVLLRSEVRSAFP